MISKSTVNAIRSHGLDRMHEEWKRKKAGKKCHGRLADCFQELVDLDIAGALLAKSENDRKRAVNAIRPGSFTTFGKHAIKDVSDEDTGVSRQDISEGCDSTEGPSDGAS